MTHIRLTLMLSASLLLTGCVGLRSICASVGFCHGRTAAKNEVPAPPPPPIETPAAPQAALSDGANGPVPADPQVPAPPAAPASLPASRPMSSGLSAPTPLPRVKTGKPKPAPTAPMTRSIPSLQQPATRPTLPQATAKVDASFNKTSFSYCRASLLVPARSGTGSREDTVYAPDMLFPIRSDFPAFVGTAVYAPGGRLPGRIAAKKGGRCAPLTYSYPWRDNFCEFRDSKTPRPPSCGGTGKFAHQGNDIRAGDPALCRTMEGQAIAFHDQIPVLAVADGTIVHIGEISVILRAIKTDAAGRKSELRFYYLHLNPKKLMVTPMQGVKKGQPIGYLSRWFGQKAADKDTINHLHFEIRGLVSGARNVPLPPYPSLVRAYEQVHPASKASDATCLGFLD